jgi:hypothetical protein
VLRSADQRCFAAFEPFVGKPPNRSTLAYYHYSPLQRDWSLLGDRTVLCMVASPEGPVTGTLRGADR